MTRRGGVPRSTRISVIIPARNEEHNLPILLRLLAARFCAWVVAAGPIPEGWVGKAWACWTGARSAKGNLLVFLDADTILACSALAALASTQRADGGLVSVMPLQAIRKP